jgi:CHAT domain-containing protein
MNCKSRRTLAYFVASLWKVDDDATHELMTRYYKDLWEKKLAPLEALRQAQLSILDNPGGLPKLEPPAGPAPEAKK